MKKESTSVAVSSDMSLRVELFVHRILTTGRPCRRMESRSIRGDAVDTSNAVFAVAPGRNKTPLLDVLRRYAPQRCRPGLSHLFFLEVGSGYGEHIGHFAAQGLGKEPIIWQPSDYVSPHFTSIAAHAKLAQTSERRVPDIVLQPVLLDVRDELWSTHATHDPYWTQLRPLFVDEKITGQAMRSQSLFCSHFSLPGLRGEQREDV